MENYFQAEAFNLDKVLDEFEQNEGELRTLIHVETRQGPNSESVCIEKTDETRCSCRIEVSEELWLRCHYVTPEQIIKVSDNVNHRPVSLSNSYRW